MMSTSGVLWVMIALLALSGAHGFSRKCEQLTSFHPDLPEPRTSRGYDTFAIICDGTDVMCIANYDDSPDYTKLTTWTCDIQTQSCLEDAIEPWQGRELRECPDVDACLRDQEARARYRVPHQGARVPDLSRNSSITTETRLDLEFCEIQALPAGWLRGANALTFVDAGGNRIPKLVAGSFSGRLNEIYFSGNLVNLTIESGAFVNLHSLKRLNLRGSNIVSLAPRFIVNASRLSILDLQQNRLGELPSGVFTGIRSLRTLELSENNLRTLPYDVFRGLHNLRELSLRDNELVQLPSGLLQPLTSLRTLKLSGNRIEVIPDFFVTGLHKLRDLTLNTNAIRTIFPHAFHGVDLDELELSQNRITLTEPWAKERSPFHSQKNLTHLMLGYNSISRLNRNFISALPSLARLDLTYNNFTELNISITQFGERYRDLTVDLSSNSIVNVTLEDGEIERDPEDPSVHFKLDNNPLRCGCALKAASRCADETAEEEGGNCGVFLELSNAHCDEPLRARGQWPATVFETLRCPPNQTEVGPQ